MGSGGVIAVTIDRGRISRSLVLNGRRQRDRKAFVGGCRDVEILEGVLDQVDCQLVSDSLVTTGRNCMFDQESGVESRPLNPVLGIEIVQ